MPEACLQAITEALELIFLKGKYYERELKSIQDSVKAALTGALALDTVPPALLPGPEAVQ